MAIVALASKTIIGGVAAEQLYTCRAVVIDTTVSGQDLPAVRLAPANATNVYVALIPPDLFARPTPAAMFLRHPYALGITNAYPDANTGYHPSQAQPYVIESGQYYMMGPSLLPYALIPSGWMVQLHRGGAYVVYPDGYVASTAIRIPGTSVAVAAQGKFVASTTNVVGVVIDYDATTQAITVLLDKAQG